MRSVFLWALALLALLASNAHAEDHPNYFEGTVTMRVEVEPGRIWSPLDEGYWIHGTEQRWTYARGDWRIDYQNSELLSVWYRRDENREYSLRVCDDIVIWIDAGEPFITVHAVRETGLEREIAGYAARAIDVRATVDGEDYSSRYWYAPAIPVNPEWYAEDRTAGFASLYEHIDSLIVGIEFETEFSRVRRFATEIDIRPVSDDELAMPDMPMEELVLDADTATEICPMPAVE